MRHATAVFVIALLGTVAGCGRPPKLVSGPIDLTRLPTTVRFDRPGDSNHAATIHATLLFSSGGRAALRTPTLDRRGESTVCRIGELASAQPDAAGASYESVELDSEVPLRLRGIRGGPRS